MTTGNDSAQPDPKDQPLPAAPDAAAPALVDANAPPAQPDAVAEAAARMQADPDLLELSEALKAVKAEETAKDAPAGTEQVEGKPGEPQKPAAAQEQKPAGAKPSVPLIPKPRFDQALEGQRKAEHDAAYWRGVAEARAQQQAQPGQQPPVQNAPPKPQDKLATIHAAQDELAAKFDSGEITMADMKKQERALTDQEMQLREELLLSKVKPADQPKGGDDKLYLDRLTVDLEVKHPWTGVFNEIGTDADWDYLSKTAMANLAARGVDPKNGSIGTYEFRKEIAELADQFGPALVGPRATAAGITLPNGQAPSQGQQQQQPKPLSAEAKARANKLALQHGAPPNLNDMRGSGEDPMHPTDSRVENMSDDEIAALPAAVRNKFLGISVPG